MKLHCKCGVDYEGHHASKYCPQCKAAGLKVKTPTESYAKDVGDFKDSQERSAIIDDAHWGLSPITAIIPEWHRYGMCDGGYEVWPGWVWSQKKLVCANGDAPKEVLEWLQDAIQRPVVNRRPILGDDDYPGGK